MNPSTILNDLPLSFLYSHSLLNQLSSLHGYPHLRDCLSDLELWETPLSEAIELLEC